MASPQANRNSCPTIYFAKVPNFQDLCTVSLQVTSDSPGISNIAQFGSQPQIIKCRELIFTEPNVLASPSLQEQGLIFVIIQQSFWKTGKLQARCQKSGLKINKPTRVIPAVFQACLGYTLKAKLAPLWNKAGDLYIQGRDFLTTSTKAKAVGVEINVTDAEICIALKPAIVRLSQSDIRDFEISPGVVEHFFSSIDNSIPEYAIEDKWCHILPSLKKGKLVSITHKILPSSPFKTYKDIRRYWKNAYGYRLPESDTGMIYYNVYFPAIGNTLFTYPDFCVYKHEPVMLARVDPATIIPTFLSDVKTKLPSICGFAFKVNPKAQYPTTGLYQASIQNNSLNRLTLATVPPQHQNHPLRRMPHQSHAHHNAPQHRPGLPNRALAKAFDAAFQQAGSNREQPNQSQISTNMQIYGSPMAGSSMANPGVPSQRTLQHGARLSQISTNMQTYASPMAGSLASPNAQPLSQYGSRLCQISTNMQMHASPMAGSVASPGVQLLSQHNAGTPQHGARATPTTPHHRPTPPSTNMQGHYSSASPAAPQSTETASPRVLSPPQGQVSEGHWQNGARGATSHMARYRAILPTSSPPAAMHPPRRLICQSPPAGMIQPRPATTPGGYHQTPSVLQSPSAVGTQHTSVHHSPLMSSNPAAQHPLQLNRTLSSPQSANPTANVPHQSHQVTNHYGQAPHPHLGTFQFPSSPPPSMQTPIPLLQQSPVVAKIVPSFRPHKPRNVSSHPQLSQQANKVVPSFKPAVKRSITPTFAAKVQLNFDAEPNDDQRKEQEVAATLAQLKTNLGIAQATPTKPSFGAKMPTPMKPSFAAKTPSAPKSGTPSKPVKRKAKDGGGDPTPKKPRAKPKVQDVDIQALVINDQLSKVNTVTLVTWLKDKGIKVKSREKKPDLIAKVVEFINAKTMEH